MTNILTAAEIKRWGMAVMEEALERGPVPIVKRNKAAAVMLSDEAYQRLAHGSVATPGAMTALRWLLAQPSSGKRGKAAADLHLAATGSV